MANVSVKSIYGVLSVVNRIMLSLILLLSINKYACGDDMVNADKVTNRSHIKTADERTTQTLCNTMTISTDGKRHLLPIAGQVLLKNSFKEESSGIYKKENVRFGDIRKELGIKVQELELIPCGSGHSYYIDVEGGRIVINFIKANYDIENVANEEKTNNNLVNVMVGILKEMKPLSSDTNAIPSGGNHKVLTDANDIIGKDRK